MLFRPVKGRRCTLRGRQKTRFLIIGLCQRYLFKGATFTEQTGTSLMDDTDNLLPVREAQEAFHMVRESQAQGPVMGCVNSLSGRHVQYPDPKYKPEDSSRRQQN